MSGESPREKAAAEASRQAAGYQKELGDVAYPELKTILSQVMGDMSGGFGAIPGSVSGQFAGLKRDMNTYYDNAKSSSMGTIKQEAKQGGGVYSTEMLSDATRSAGIALERDRAASSRQLDFQEAQAGMGQFNSLMSMLGGGARTGMNIGSGALGIEMGALSGINNTSQMGGFISGASAGAGAGGAAGGPWGALIGGVLGGAYGYSQGG